MSLFRRRREPEPSEPSGPSEPAEPVLPRQVPGPPDHTWSFLDRTQAARFRMLTHSAFAENGLEVTAYADHVEDLRGTVFGLGNLAAICGQTEDDDWPEVIRDHVATIVRATQEPSPLDSMDTGQVRAAVFSRVMNRADVPSFATYGRDLADDLVEVLNLDEPDSVRLLNDDHVRSFGPPGPLFDAGRHHLRGLRFARHERLVDDEASFHCVMDDSMFTASAVLLLDEVAASVGDPIDPELGAFVVVPYRHQLAFHVWRGGKDAIASITRLLQFAQAGIEDNPGPVSAEIFWWRPTGLEQLSHTADGQTHVEIRGELAALFSRSGEPGPEQ